MYVQDFIKCPMWRLRCMPPCAETHEDLCLLTCKTATEIRHAVKTQDGRIYEALSLQRWLRLQKNGYFVVPGVDIQHVESYSWMRYACFVCLHFPHILRHMWLSAYILFHVGRVVCKVATTAKRVGTGKEHVVVRKKITIPGPNSAFHPFCRSHFALQRL